MEKKNHAPLNSGMQLSYDRALGRFFLYGKNCQTGPIVFQYRQSFKNSILIYRYFHVLGLENNVSSRLLYKIPI